LTITMAPKKDCFSFENSDGFETNVPEFLKPEFSIPANAFEKNDGTPYTGTVTICYIRVKKDTTFFNDLVASSFSTALTTGKPYRISPFGAFMIEATDNNGAYLKLKMGKKINTTIEYYDPFYSLYPDETPALFLDRDNGNTWKEEGKMTKEKNSIEYVFDITKVNTMWTSGSDIDIVLLSGILVDKEGKPLKDYSLIVKNDETGKNYYANSSDDGKFGAFVIAGKTSTISVYCGNTVVFGVSNSLLKTVSIPAKTKNEDIGNLVVENITAIKGKVVDCNNNPVTSGTVTIAETFDNVKIESDGTFRYYMTCEDIKGNKMTITPYANGMTGANKIITIDPDKITDIGALSVCNTTPKSSIFIKFDGKDYYFDENFNWHKGIGNDNLSADKLDGNGYRIAAISFYKPIVINQPQKMAQLLMQGQEQAAGSFEEWIDCQDCLSVTISTYSATEVQGTISGTTPDGKAVTGNFYYKK
jgi:hypothetical protein